MSKLGTIGAKLHRGEISYDFVGKRKLWFTVSLVLVAISLLGLFARGLALGIEFKGGVEYQANVKVTDSTVDDFSNAVKATNAEDLGDPVVTTIGTDKVRVQTRPLSQDDITKVRAAIAQEAGVQPNQVSNSQIGASWGDQIANKAIWALVVFLFLVFLVIWAYFREPKASMAAIIALVHDVLITIGVYALVGFDVTPATVIGVLTILGYSLYDTVVVFDKVRENTRGITGSNRQTYSDAANLAVNQTVVRSINTTLIALMPVGSILVVGTVVLGTGPLKDLSLALFVGIAIGAYSSVFIAPALLAAFKEREPGMQALRRRVMARRAQTAGSAGTPVPALAGAGATGATAAPAGATRVQDVRPKSKGVTAGTPVASNRPVKSTGAAGRPQPTRKPRSKRGK
ncbi:protein-export membrane protein SecF [Kribbella flavida DSM 17836]|uniref:Protein-export membrane protein SecF n=1 Tax=Kribbella flavida (strain DSM 17836 / JCM 10339 / NBRC 14399) TaxID=479435 RepID=D2PVF2_KRIFD|nr:protein translocase subunit SecF [Kribbella flavida]ADB33433.1 protein-export membrane protein SecF [Kribbella flavida DSM 17836]